MEFGRLCSIRALTRLTLSAAICRTEDSSKAGGYLRADLGVEEDTSRGIKRGVTEILYALGID